MTPRVCNTVEILFLAASWSLFHTFPSEFRAWTNVFPDCIMRVCLFHVIRNVKAAVQHTLGTDGFRRLKALIMTMSHLRRDEKDVHVAFKALDTLFAMLPPADSEDAIYTSVALKKQWHGTFPHALL